MSQEIMYNTLGKVRRFFDDKEGFVTREAGDVEEVE